MDTLTYTEARENFAKVMEGVCDDHTPVLITRGKKRKVVLLSLEDYQSMDETNYLLRSPKNAERLMESIQQLESDKGIERDISEIL